MFDYTVKYEKRVVLPITIEIHLNRNLNPVECNFIPVLIVDGSLNNIQVRVCIDFDFLFLFLINFITTIIILI